MYARQPVLASSRFGDDIEKLFPIIQPGGNDSAAFDNALELLVMSGRSLPHAMAMLIPEAWSKDKYMSPQKRGFYEYPRVTGGALGLVRRQSPSATAARSVLPWTETACVLPDIK